MKTILASKRKKRAIEPIVAAILLIAIAIVAGALLYLWVSKLAASSQGSMPTSANVQVVAQYYKTLSSGSAIVVIVNSPAKPYATTAIIYNSTGYVVATSKSCTVSSIGTSSETYNITCTLSSKLNPGTYYARITTTNVGTISTGAITVT